MSACGVEGVLEGDMGLAVRTEAFDLGVLASGTPDAPHVQQDLKARAGQSSRPSSSDARGDAARSRGALPPAPASASVTVPVAMAVLEGELVTRAGRGVRT